MDFHTDGMLFTLSIIIQNDQPLGHIPNLLAHCRTTDFLSLFLHDHVKCFFPRAAAYLEKPWLIFHGERLA